MATQPKQGASTGGKKAGKSDAEPKPTTLVVDTLNGQTVTLVDGSDGWTLRVAKEGHNRAVAKLSNEVAAQLATFIAERG